MSENKTTIKEIKKTVESWLESNRIKILNNNIDIEINRNEEDLYFIELNKDNDYLVDLKVHLPEFAPYRYISFEIIGMQNNEIPGVIYAWYDDENSTLGEIINNLDSSLDYLINLGKNTDNSKFKIWKIKKELLERVKLFDEAEKLRTYNAIKFFVEREDYHMKFKEGEIPQGNEILKAFEKILEYLLSRYKIMKKKINFRIETD